MLNQMNDIGEDLYRSWSYQQCQDEIGKLVDGYRNGLPVQILCHLATTIAGSQALAQEHLAKFLTNKERKAMVRKESGSNRALRDLLEATLLQK